MPDSLYELKVEQLIKEAGEAAKSILNENQQMAWLCSRARSSLIFCASRHLCEMQAKKLGNSLEGER